MIKSNKALNFIAHILFEIAKFFFNYMELHLRSINFEWNPLTESVTRWYIRLHAGIIPKLYDKIVTNIVSRIVQESNWFWSPRKVAAFIHSMTFLYFDLRFWISNFLKLVLPIAYTCQVKPW